MKLSVVVPVALVIASASAFVPESSSKGVVAFARTIGASQQPFAKSSTSLHMSTEMDFVKDQIDSNDVMVFSKSYCPFCDATKTLFGNMEGVDATVVEVDQRDDADGITQALLDLSGQRTFPNVFVKGTHIGGNDQTQLAAKMGKIQKLLEA